ncbi:MAG: PIN domain-containing protein [Cytophagia bacterium]|nr:PIN domain-containing protein [Cytophagia bacterium]
MQALNDTLPVLVDTSVWIAFLKNQESRETALLADLMTEENTVCTCPLIFQQVLNGISDDKDYERIKKPSFVGGWSGVDRRSYQSILEGIT